MNIISHRGNLYGQDSSTENSPKQIEGCIQSGFDCEIDLRSHQGCLYLGHDTCQYRIDLNWLVERSEVLWIHCKDSETLTYLKNFGAKLNYFWHETDKHAITSKGIFWNYPGGPITSDCIVVLPESWWVASIHSPLSEALGICTDFPYRFREELKLA